MNKQLAIKGHPTRGNEVIELLKMLGGRDVGVLKGNHDYYVIDECENNLIKFYAHNYIHCHEFVVLTLEEFLEKYPFKVGDVIKFPNNMAEEITEMKWDEKLEDIIYTSVSGSTRPHNIPKNIENKTNMKTYNMDISVDNNYSISECKTIGQDTYAIKIADGYKFDRIDENGNIIVKSIKPTYPKTYKECCNVLSISPYYNLRYHTYERCHYNEFATSNELRSLEDKLNTLGKLIICRNAYWKIAGEQMGLGKPWEPDWNEHEFKYGLKFMDHKIEITCDTVISQVICFPASEMRDAFYENFKDLLEGCKELLKYENI